MTMAGTNQLRRVSVECAQCGALTSIAASDKGAIREYIDAGLLVVWCQNCTTQRDDHPDPEMGDY